MPVPKAWRRENKGRKSAAIWNLTSHLLSLKLEPADCLSKMSPTPLACHLFLLITPSAFWVSRAQGKSLYFLEYWLRGEIPELESLGSGLDFTCYLTPWTRTCFPAYKLAWQNSYHDSLSGGPPFCELVLPCLYLACIAVTFIFLPELVSIWWWVRLRSILPTVWLLYTQHIAHKKRFARQRKERQTDRQTHTHTHVTRMAGSANPIPNPNPWPPPPQWMDGWMEGWL